MDLILSLEEKYGISKADFEYRVIEQIYLRSLIIKHPRFTFEDYKHSQNIPYHLLKEGHVLYLYNTSTYDYEEIVITHIYGGVVFYKKNNCKDDTIKHFEDNSFMFNLLYPKVILKPSIMDLQCKCKLTEIKNW
ncbi:MAG: hypothetical protein J5767_12550 [Paludibacteraceae bacterium]|nr:hypothetical protein [Paludibacteraceae bacterium]